MCRRGRIGTIVAIYPSESKNSAPPLLLYAGRESWYLRETLNHPTGQGLVMRFDPSLLPSSMDLCGRPPLNREGS